MRNSIDSGHRYRVGGRGKPRDRVYGPAGRARAIFIEILFSTASSLRRGFSYRRGREIDICTRNYRPIRRERMITLRGNIVSETRAPSTPSSRIIASRAFFDATRERGCITPALSRRTIRLFDRVHPRSLFRGSGRHVGHRGILAGKRSRGNARIPSRTQADRPRWRRPSVDTRSRLFSVFLENQDHRGTTRAVGRTSGVARDLVAVVVSLRFVRGDKVRLSNAVYVLIRLTSREIIALNNA